MASTNRWLYNGKELQDAAGLDLLDYGFRMYDPFKGSWNGMDDLAEKYFQFSPYSFVGNNTINRIDPDGKQWISYLERDENEEDGISYRRKYKYIKDGILPEDMHNALGLKDEGLFFTNDSKYYSMDGNIYNTTGFGAIAAGRAMERDYARSALISYADEKRIDWEAINNMADIASKMLEVITYDKTQNKILTKISIGNQVYSIIATSQQVNKILNRPEDTSITVNDIIPIATNLVSLVSIYGTAANMYYNLAMDGAKGIRQIEKEIIPQINKNLNNRFAPFKIPY
ncbi:MAG: hypothetical protein LUF87_03820 [Alistipes sp.]|nr:hypothetical protein [Alistipes sp.]